MSNELVFTNMELAYVSVNKWTDWTFVTLYDRSGLSSVMETTCGQDVTRELSQLMDLLKEKPLSEDKNVIEISGLTASQIQIDLPMASAISAFSSAVTDIQAQYQNNSLTESLGGKQTRKIPLYANINRALLGGTRTPKEFARIANQAVKDGFNMVKCAPFDEVNPSIPLDNVFDASQSGLERVSLIRETVGPDVTILVDCHSRFDVQSAPQIAYELKALDVSWFEEPVEPTKVPHQLADIASSVSIPIAGGESGFGEQFFGDLVNLYNVDIAMPDIKYCGGIQEAVRAAEQVARFGGNTSLHGPTGPISILAGAHVTASMKSALNLEFGVYECPWRADLLNLPEQVEGGHLWFPGGIGLGAELNQKVVDRYGSSWAY
tara:strand:- start:559 stop:1692 length:1134 start_codon:yes stop_codon:yes gene_type:complete